MAGTWALITNPPANIDTMLLMTDGTVLAHELDTANWHRLTPDSAGKYETGAWSAVASMPNNPAIPAASGGPTYAPRFFGSAVLKDGSVLIAGGEYNHLVSVDMKAATLYQPLTNSWTNLPTPATWTHMGDVPLCVMPDGRVLLGNIDDTETTFFDPVTQTYTAGPNKGDRCAEESFTLLADGTVLAVQCSNIPRAEKYNPATNSWVSAGSTPSTLPQACPGIVPEIGPSVLLTSGHVYVIGATGNTAIYSPPAAPASPGVWSAGPTLTDAHGQTQFAIDAPAALMPNGKVLLAASPSPPCNFPGPTVFFEYDPTKNSVALVPLPANSAGPCFFGRMLVIPTGQVLFSSHSSTIAIYTPDGTPNALWRPVITGFPSTVHHGQTVTLTGNQLNGLSQCSYYGDDATMATNYPIVRLTSTAGAVTYCRTSNHSTMAVATGTATVSTSVTIPASLPIGAYTLEVIANGIPSAGITVNVSLLKFPKLEKFEIKELKHEKIEILEHKNIIQDTHKIVFETKLKDAENIEYQQQVSDPALVAAIRQLSDRIDSLSGQINSRAPITPDERPAVGEAPLLHSSSPINRG